MVNKETLIIALKLFLITALTALLLAVVNKVTAPVIASNNEALAIESQKEVLPDGRILYTYHSTVSYIYEFTEL